MQELQLRPIVEADLERVREIFAEAFEVSPPPQLEYIEKLGYSDPDGCLVGEVDGELVGYAYTHRSGSIGYIGSIAVDERMRGKGYGKALTVAARDHLLAHCEVVGLSVEPHRTRNLELYTACGFEAVMPACFLFKQLAEDRERLVAPSIRSAQQLGDAAAEAIEQVRGWSAEIFPGLDLTRDFELFAREYPEQLWFDFEGAHVRGFMAYNQLFRGDAWGAVRPGPADLDSLGALVDAVVASVKGPHMWFHLHTNFRRALPVIRSRGFRVQCHKACMVVARQVGAWPARSDAIFLRPWWT